MPGTRKAAFLLTCLDRGAAAELLKAARPDLVPEIAAEMVQLEAFPERANEASTALVADFMTMLTQPKADPNGGNAFVRQVLESAVGKQRSEDVFGQARRLIDMRDPFRSLRDASVEELAAALADEHPQVIAMVIMELPPPKSTALVPMLDDASRREAVRRMTSGDSVSPEARMRVAAIVKSRLDAVRKARAAAERDGTAPVVAGAPGGPKYSPRLRQVALLLRSLATELRDTLVKSVTEGNAETGTLVQNLMVLWEDMPIIGDRNLQEVLRNVDARKLALSLVGAPPAIAAKVNNNISERARAMITEETELMKKPKAEDIDLARETILGYLRQLNASGELQFEGGPQ